MKFIKFNKIQKNQQLGVAQIAIDCPGFSLIMLGFKVIAKKDGGGYFISEPTFYDESTDTYHSWITIDSNIAKDQIYDMIRSHVSPVLRGTEIGQNQAPQQTNHMPTAPAYDQVPF